MRRGRLAKIMNNKLNPRNRFIHLYNPKEEGLGCYDVHYINAYKKNKRLRNKANKNVEERHIA